MMNPFPSSLFYHAERRGDSTRAPSVTASLTIKMFSLNRHKRLVHIQGAPRPAPNEVENGVIHPDSPADMSEEDPVVSR